MKNKKLEDFLVISMLFNYIRRNVSVYRKTQVMSVEMESIVVSGLESGDYFQMQNE